jgi:arylsulfatase
MGYRTPNIDRVAKEGCNFTDWYGQQSCTAGRAAFITGSRRSAPASRRSASRRRSRTAAEDPTIADVLKPLGYVSGQFGKNHLGDRDEFLPTAHGFDEFFGNLYHLNAEQEPENPDYPKDPEFKKKFGRAACCTRGPTPTARRRSRTPDRSRSSAWKPSTRNSSTRAQVHGEGGQGQQAVLRLVELDADAHLHALEKGVRGKDRPGIYPDGMVEHDGHVGKLLDKLDELKIADNTIVMYSTDNGAEVMSWPDGGTTPFRGEKDTNFEGGWRVPCAIPMARRNQGGHRVE